MAKLSIRDKTEVSLSRLMGKLLSQQQARILKQVEAEYITMGTGFWEEEEQKMAAALKPLVLVAIQDGAQLALTDTFRSKKTSPDFAGDIIARAVEVAGEYSFGLIRQITATTRNVVESTLVEFITTPGFTGGDFVDLIGVQFSPVRASTIAVTETTRIYAMAGKLVAEELRAGGMEMDEIWNTNNDALTCEICGPLHRTTKDIDWVDYPPAHPNCRCWVTRRLKT